ncbi:MAG: tRNA (guanosine(37)-N1)-methyltransferase TrmD [Gammaproteobacteria bacterium]|nr:tRNA (guanosine(37)-N1)-methyltransferase TrmD [Gammaproteobacteria bacterium]
MRIGVVSLFPELIRGVVEHGVVGRAAERGLMALSSWNPRDYTRDRHRSVDDQPYGGGPGMVMLCQPLLAAIAAARAAVGTGARTIYLTPQGRRLDHERVRALAAEDGFVLVCGRYEGIDERVIAAAIDEELSIGDYVLSGGELAAMVVVDAVTRMLPGALGDAGSAAEDSFVDGMLDYPHYTRPETVGGMTVPAVLLSGDHGAVARWRRKQALGRTWLRRPDLLAARPLDACDRALLNEYLAEQTVHGDCRAPLDDRGQDHEQAD